MYHGAERVGVSREPNETDPPSFIVTVVPYARRYAESGSQPTRHTWCSTIAVAEMSAACSSCLPWPDMGILDINFAT